ncbi:hypothetical protein R1sor_025060 [Riccia sorocarpa]|uniref:Uncharacterized protein n=1 Tax=Riccia sorocarpa TaxID=122646 RepID=A0ABD3GA97_9MARC
MNEAIAQTTELADTPIVINGDIRTTTVKRKSAYSTGIGKNDTHRHDKVARTQQAVRLVRELPVLRRPDESARVAVNISSDGNDEHSPRRSPVQDITNQPASENGDGPTIEGEATEPARVADTFVEDTTNTAGNVIHSDWSPDIHTISSDSDIEIIEITSRRRPPTRAYPAYRQAVLDDNRPKQFGIVIVEVDADVTKWCLSRTSYTGAGPACYAATPGRSAKQKSDMLVCPDVVLV